MWNQLTNTTNNVTKRDANVTPGDKSLLSSKDFDYTTQMNRYSLKLIGIWPASSNASTVDKFITESLIVCCYFCISFLLVPCALHTLLIEKDPTLRIKMIGPMSFCLMAMTKFSCLVFHRNDIYNCLEHIAADWSTVRSSRERRIMLDDAKFGNNVASLCACFMYGAFVFYHTIMPFASGPSVSPLNITLRPLAYPVYDRYFDVQTSGNYEIVFVTQWFSGLIMCTVTVGACSIAAVFALHACGQFKIIVDRLRKLVDGDEDRCDSVDDRMIDIFELHLRALRLVKRLERILNGVCFVELIGCTMTVCFGGYSLMKEWEHSETANIITYGALLVSFTLNILIFCYIGEKLTEQSKEVGTMTYMIDWYRLQSAQARGLILILVVSKYPACITAGKIAELSMYCFSNVMKTSFTYLNLLRTMMD